MTLELMSAMPISALRLSYLSLLLDGRASAQRKILDLMKGKLEIYLS